VNTESQLRQLFLEEKVLLWIYIFSFAFDFKGDVGGSLSQFIMAGLSIGAGLGFILYGYRVNISVALSPGLKKVTALWWVYLFSTAFTALITDVMFERYIRVFFPLLLCGISLLIICKFQTHLIDPHEILKPLLFATLVAVLWKIYYATQIAGIELYHMRYQILSGGGVCFLLAYVVTDTIVKQRFKPMTIIALAIVGIAAFLSITRSLILTVFFLFCGYLWMAFRTSLFTNVKRTLSLVLIFTLILISCWYISNKLHPGISHVWMDRIFYKDQGYSISKDVTLWTRLSEWSGQWESLSKNMPSLLFGKGLGAEYFWDTRFSSRLRSVMNIYELQRKSGWYSGHSMWMYSLYSGGLLFGWVIITISLLALFRIMAVIRNTSLGVAPFQQDIAPLLFFMVLVFISQGFTSSPLVNRFFALIIGLVFGMIYWFYDYVRHEEA